MDNHEKNHQREFLNKKIIIKTIFWCFSIILPIVIFFILLNVNLPIPILNVLTNNSIYAFFVIFGLYVLSFRLKGKIRWFLGLTLTVILIVTPLIYKWLTAYSDAAVIGSFLPYKDGFYFYQGARTFLLGRVITNGYNDVFRPLVSGFLSSTLILTGNNLLITLSLLVLVMGYSCYIASEQVNELFGPWSAALFMSLMVVYARHFVGYTASEIPGIILACLSFFLLLRGAVKQKLFDLSLGSVIQVLAFSIRAAAYFILPAIAIWAGLAFRKKKAFDWKTSITVLLCISITFGIASFVLPRILEKPGLQNFGIFANFLYGQAHGGAGPNQAGIDLQGSGASYNMVMEEALWMIQHHPVGLMIGITKSYLVFFGPFSDGIFQFIDRAPQWIGLIFWIWIFGLLIAGIVYCFQRLKTPIYSLFLACFIGLLVSLPFAPPMNLGNRIYAGSIPFLFIICALGLKFIWNEKKTDLPEPSREEGSTHIFVNVLSFVLFLLIFVGPVLLRYFSKSPDYVVAECSKTQTPFAFQLYQGSFVDILKNNNSNCGRTPNLCLADFEENGKDKPNDDFFRALVQETKESKTGIRVIPSVDLISSNYYFFVGTLDRFAETTKQTVIMGCATRMDSEFQKVLWIDSVLK
jgi:hypothetical protein